MLDYWSVFGGSGAFFLAVGFGAVAFFFGFGGGAQTPQVPPELQCLQYRQFLHAVQYLSPEQRPP